jgi:hypothetical protein
MIPLDLLVALAPSILLAGLWLADRIPPRLASRTVRQRRAKRLRLIELISQADRRPACRRHRAYLP